MGRHRRKLFNVEKGEVITGRRSIWRGTEKRLRLPRARYLAILRRFQSIAVGMRLYSWKKGSTVVVRKKP